MAAKVTIQPYQCSDQPVPPFHKISRETVSYIRVTIFLIEGTNKENLNPLFYSILREIRASAYRNMLIQTNAQSIENERFCIDFHLNENNKEKADALMGLIKQHLGSQKNFPPAEIKP